MPNAEIGSICEERLMKHEINAELKSESGAVIGAWQQDTKEN
jgi:hypothetical protein